MYGSFTTETILAVAFGQNSDSTGVDHTRNELTKAVDSLSQQIEEGRMTSFGALIVLISKRILSILASSIMCFHDFVQVTFHGWFLYCVSYFSIPVEVIAFDTLTRLH